MNLSRFSIHRPIFTIMVTLMVIILGGVSLHRLSIDLMPDITYPTISVITTYENASPEEVEELITRPIEEAMAAIPGVEEITSISREGSSNVRVTFTWGTDLDVAANDIRDRLDRVIRRLPDTADRPMLRKFDLASYPILILGVASKLDPIQLRRIIDDQIKYRIERIPGVAALDVYGGLDREIHVDLYADKIKALGLPLDQILNRIKAENINLPAGKIDRGNYEVTVRTPGEYTSLDQLRNTVVAVRDGAPIQLKEIAHIEDSWQRVIRIVRVDGQRGVRLAVNKQSGKNTVEVAEKVLEEIERINQDIPQIHLVPIIDTAAYIKRSISHVGSAAMYGGILVILVLLVFLRNIPSTAIISAAIPISIIATFVLMYFWGFSLNIMTFGALALGVGMMVDSSIVVLENIYRLRESGYGVDRAALEGSEEVTSAILASVLTLMVVFLPLLFVPGMAGVMFKQLAVVVSFSLFCSLVVALSLVPMLTVKALRTTSSKATTGETSGHKIFRISGRMLKHMEDSYKGLLRFALNHRLLVITTAVVLLASSLALVPLIGVEFMPSTDEGEVRIEVEMDVGTRLAVLEEKFKYIEEIVKQSVPEMKSMVASIGSFGWLARGPHTGDMRIALKPIRERRRSSEEIARSLRQKLAGIPGAIVRTRAGEGLFILRLGMGGTDKIQVEIRGYDLQRSVALAQRVKKVVEDVEGVTDARISREEGSPEEQIIVDRQKAADMKLSVEQIANMLQTVLSGTKANFYRDGGKEYDILVKVKDAERMDLRDILDLTLTNAAGQPVVLRNVVEIRPRSGPVRVERKDQERVNIVSGNISGRDMGSVIADIRESLRSVPVPRDSSIVFGGDYEEQQKAFQELLLAFVLALILVYVVMACQYESLRDPFVIMFSVPLAAIGVIVVLILTNTNFSVQSFIGCIMLGGIVVNNAILLVDHANLLRRRDGMPLREAIEEAGRRRLRPILMTSLTTILGLVPLALGLGEGGEAQAPMARVVIGGLSSSTFITLVFVPVIYFIFAGKVAEKYAKVDAIELATSSRGQRAVPTPTSIP